MSMAPRLRLFGWVLAFAAGFFLLSLLAMEARAGLGEDSAFWGLSGLSTAALSQAPRATRSWLAGAVVVSCAVCYVIIGTPLPDAAGLAMANGIQAVLAAGLIRRHLPQGRRIVRLSDIGWLALAAIYGAAAGSGLGALAKWLASGTFEVNGVVTWFAANAVGILVGGPVFFAMISLRREPPPQHRWLPMAAAGAATVLVFAGSTWASTATGRNFSYLLIVPVVVSAVWLGQRHTALLVGGLAIAVAVVTSRGGGPFAATESSFDALLAGQLFMSVVQLTALTVGVESSRRRDGIAELDAILSATAEGVLVIDETRTIRRANASSESILGLSPRDLVGRSLSAFVDLGDTEHSATLHLTKARRDDGSEFWAEISMGDIHERSGRRRTAVVIRDVTSRVEAEEQVRRMQDEFVSNMTHELKTPLTAIIGFSDLILDDLDESTDVAAIETIRDSALSMKALIDDILDFKRVAGASGEVAPVDLRAVVQSALDLVRPSAAERSIEVVVNFEACPPVMGESLQLESAVQNVLSNAVKYSNPGGHVTIDLDELAGSVVLSVVDQGIGIHDADQVRLFSRFYRARNVGEVQGTGLGLALVRQVVEQHGGHVELVSALGRGTRVRITLPAIDHEAGRLESHRRAMNIV